jgi:hypothetical protein
VISADSEGTGDATAGSGSRGLAFDRVANGVDFLDRGHAPCYPKDPRNLKYAVPHPAGTVEQEQVGFEYDNYEDGYELLRQVEPG